MQLCTSSFRSDEPTMRVGVLGYTTRHHHNHQRTDELPASGFHTEFPRDTFRLTLKGSGISISQN